MINARTFIGRPFDFNGICQIYPPKIIDIIENDNYQIYQKLLTITQEEIYDATVGDPIDDTPHFTVSLDVDGAPAPLRMKRVEQKILTPLEYLLNNCYNNSSFLEVAQDAFRFFTHSSIIPIYEQKMIYIGDINDLSKYNSLATLPLLKEDNYFQFQNAIRQSLGLKLEENYNLDTDPRILRMKAKARYRDKIKAKNGQGISFETMLVSICCMNLNITPLNIGELSYGAVQSLFSVYQNKEKYELDIQSLLAGADAKKIKPKHWISNLNE